MFVLELRVLRVLQRSPEGSGAPMDFADVGEPCIRIKNVHFFIFAGSTVLLLLHILTQHFPRINLNLHKALSGLRKQKNT